MVAKEIADIIIKAFKRGNKLLICGCGGSCAMASHFAGELVGKYKHDRKALPAIALNDSPIITAIGNDFSFDYVFSRQVEALGKKGDVLVTLSTSGKSPCVLEAIKVAKEMGLEVIEIPRQGYDTPRIQENQLAWVHQICEIAEEAFI